MKCLVSGATGFVGRNLCQSLRSRGDTIIPLSNSGKPLPDGTPTTALDLASGDLEVLSMQGAQVVYHLAGIAHRQAEPEAYQQINYEATLRLAARAEASGVECFVFLSSVKAMGSCATQDCRSESDLYAPTDDYGRWKLAAEQALQEQYRHSAMAVVILRPSLVYGSGARGNLALMARTVRWGLPRPPDVGGRSMVSVHDLTQLLGLLGENPPPGVNTWIVADGQSYSTRRIYDGMRHSLGRGRGWSWLPQPLWQLGCQLLDMRAGGHGESTWDKLFATELYSSAALRAATGWSPEQQLETLLPAMMECQQP